MKHRHEHYSLRMQQYEKAALAYLRIQNPQWGDMKRIAMERGLLTGSLSTAIKRSRQRLRWTELRGAMPRFILSPA